jgi:hypothetical protein
MLTQAQIDAGTARNGGNTLSAVDVSKTAKVLRKFMAELVDKYDYDYEGSLAALDDADGEARAAQVAACIIKLEELGIGVASLAGAVNYREKDEYTEYVLLIHAQMYDVPFEWSGYARRTASTRTSQTVGSYRRELTPSRGSERERRRRRC